MSSTQPKDVRSAEEIYAKAKERGRGKEGAWEGKTAERFER